MVSAGHDGTSGGMERSHRNHGAKLFIHILHSVVFVFQEAVCLGGGDESLVDTDVLVLKGFELVDEVLNLLRRRIHLNRDT